MKITIEDNGVTKVYEDVRLFAGVLVMDGKSTAMSVLDKSFEDNEILVHAAAARGMRELLKENRFSFAENFVELLSKIKGKAAFSKEERREE